jgi:hypothetical protein
MRGINRPPTRILSDNSIVPERNRISPEPNRFSHRVTHATDYWWGGEEMPAGQLPSGTEVLVLRADGLSVWVADGRGLYVRIGASSLTAL